MVPTLYFPFVVPQYLLRMGLAPLGLGESVIERDGGTAAELALKAELRRERSGYYDQALPGSEQAQREVGRVLRLAGETLAEMGRTVAEDLLILRADGGQELIAGHLYFANGWCLDEKLGKPLLDVHAPVPGYAQTLGQPTRNLLERLKPGGFEFAVERVAARAGRGGDGRERGRALFSAGGAADVDGAAGVGVRVVWAAHLSAGLGNAKRGASGAGERGTGDGADGDAGV